MTNPRFSRVVWSGAVASSLWFAAATCSDPTEPVISLSVSPSEIVMNQGDVIVLDAALVNAANVPLPDRTPLYSSNDTLVVQVTSTGVVTANGPAGTASIEITIDEYSQVVPVTVSQVISRIEPDSLTLVPGTTRSIVPIAFDLNGDRVFGSEFSFRSTATGFMSVTPEGVVSGLALGAGWVTVTAGSATKNVLVVVSQHARIRLPRGPFAIGVNGDGTVYVGCNWPSCGIYRFDLPSIDVERVLNIADQRNLVFSADGKTAFAITNQTRGLVSIEVDTNRETGLFLLGDHGIDLALSPDGTRLYAITDSGLYSFDAATLSPIDSVDFTAPMAIVVHPAGDRLYVSSANSGQVFEIGAPSLDVLRTFNIGFGPVGLAIAGDGTTLYVANGNGGIGIDVIDLPTGQITAQIPISGIPTFLALSPDESMLYVTDHSNSKLLAADLSTNSVAWQARTGLRAWRVAVSTDPELILVAADDGYVDVLIPRP